MLDARTFCGIVLSFHILSFPELEVSVYSRANAVPIRARTAFDLKCPSRFSRVRFWNVLPEFPQMRTAGVFFERVYFDLRAHGGGATLAKLLSDNDSLND
jgi:hypothetical protein